jgi:hypothetical protein
LIVRTNRSRTRLDLESAAAALRIERRYPPEFLGTPSCRAGLDHGLESASQLRSHQPHRWFRAICAIHNLLDTLRCLPESRSSRQVHKKSTTNRCRPVWVQTSTVKKSLATISSQWATGTSSTLSFASAPEQARYRVASRYWLSYYVLIHDLDLPGRLESSDTPSFGFLWRNGLQAR